MVGVPGRSKACSTCRKRKIACSLEVPACSQCTKSGRKCPGYQKERVFITSAPSSEGYESTWKPHSYSRPLANSQQPERQEIAQNYSLARCAPPGDPSDLVKASMRQQIVNGYVSSAFKDRESQTRSWISDIPSIANPSKALELATFAMCTARMGHFSQDPDNQLIRESLRLYGGGLYATRKALSDPRSIMDDQVLSACCLLGMYEVFECPSKSRAGYMSHFEGLSKLIELRGPEKHRTGIGHAMFLSFRLMGALEALMNRKTFLSRPEWIEIPFLDVEMTPFDKLITGMLRAPEIMTLSEDLVQLQDPIDQLERVKEVLKLCWDMDANLQLFYSDLDDTVDGLMYWSVDSRSKVQEMDDEGSPKPELFPADFEFANIRVATSLMYMWASQLVLYSGFRQLYLLLEVLGQMTGLTEKARSQCNGSKKNKTYAELLGFPLLGHRDDLLKPARSICQSVEYCLKHELGVTACFVPLNILENTLILWPGYERVLEWAAKSLVRLRDRGVGIVDYLPHQRMDQKTGKIYWT